MNNANFKMENIDYLFIFDYYDYPLSFISNKIDGSYRFFYFIDDYTYFLKRLSIKDIVLLFSDLSTKELLDFFIAQSDFEIIEYDALSNEINIKSISEYELDNSVKVVDFFPDENSKFEEDIISKISFSDLRRTYKTYFPDLFSNKELTIKLVDSTNSHSSKPDMVISTISLMKTFFNESKEYLKEKTHYPNEELQIIPFTPGSFNINFELSKPKKVSIFENHDELDFDNFVLFFDSLVDVEPETVYSGMIHESKEIIKTTNEFYSQMKKQDVKIEIRGREDTKLSTLSYNKKTDEYFEKLSSLILKDLIVDTKEELYDFKAVVVSASKLRNHVTLELQSGRISAKFSKELFTEIKESEKVISLSNIDGRYKKTSSFDEEGNEIDTSYEILEFTQ